ncbi:MAG: multiheme c-type cytochrome [Limisphaerales bacterium]
MRSVAVGLITVAILVLSVPSASGTERPPYLTSFSKPTAGEMEIIFHGTTGPFRIQTKTSMDPAAVWVDIPDAIVTEIQPGVFMGLVPSPKDPVDLGFYRVVSEGDPTAELKGWAVLVRVTAPANGLYFVPGEGPVVTVTILDTLGQGISRDDFSTLNLYMYGPQDPRQAVTAVKLLNASTNRATAPHHYIDLKTNPDVQVNGSVLTYHLKPVTDELPGTYTVSLWSRLAADNVQQIMKFADVQIGTTNVETAVVAKRALDGPPKCASCHEGPVSGKLYLHHIDPVPPNNPTGNWSLDYEPTRSCKSCHNNDGYAAYTNASAPGGRVPDPIVRRVHGVHMGEGLKLAFDTNSVNGDFKDYIHVSFPADVRDCTKCHLDDRWKTRPSRLACGACHDNTWFGPPTAPPTGMVVHGGGEQTDDTLCSVCHAPDTGGFSTPVAKAHRVPPPAMDVINVTMTPPANGTNYVAGEKPVVTLVIMDDSGTNAIDHTKVTDGNFSTASLFVYGPRSRTVPVLTSAARNVNSKLRASVTSSLPGPWAINGNTFRIAVNGSAPPDITIVGAGNLVTAAEVVTSLNSVITNLGAKASVSGANVSIKTLIQGANARFEIYNGDVTTAMGWKRGPNTIMEPDVTVAASFTPANDLRALSDPLDYSDPMVTRTTTNITYQLDDVTGLTPGTYGIYVYQLPKAGKIPGLTNLVGIGHLMFQVKTATPEKKVATNCADCHGDTIWHLSEGPIHPEPFDTDYCTACHDYGHPSTGDMFKNQGGTSLNGWSGFGAMPIVRRVHGVHRGHYLEHPEEIYANATKDTFGNIIFPQDIRNCTKCHAESDTWKQKPSRMACLACHDSDAAKTHGKLMTWIPDPNDPYGPTAIETCEVCHDADAEFSPDKVHSISNPYVPPYPREP